MMILANVTPLTPTKTKTYRMYNVKAIAKFKNVEKVTIGACKVTKNDDEKVQRHFINSVNIEDYTNE